MTDEELIKFLRTSTSSAYNKISADRIEQLLEGGKELTLQLLAISGQAADALDKLAKAVEALRQMMEDAEYPDAVWETGATFLAELEKTE